MNKTRCKGFSLIELIMVMVIITVGVVGITPLFANSASSLSTNETLQQAAQYAQECAERVMTTRRHPPDGSDKGFDWFATHTFSCGADPSGFTRTANPVGALCTTGCSNGSCPSGMNCRDVNITVTSTTPGLTALNSSIAFQLVYY